MTPRQLSYVNRATALLPAAARAQFMQSVTNVLGYAEYPLNDRDVLDVLRLVLAQRGISIGNVLPEPLREYARLQEGKTRHDSTPEVLRP
jgi:hypothetical protein